MTTPSTPPEASSAATGPSSAPTYADRERTDWRHLMLPPKPGDDHGPSACGNAGTTVLFARNVTCPGCRAITRVEEIAKSMVELVDAKNRLVDEIAGLQSDVRQAGAKALRDAARALDLGQTEPHTREDRIGAAGAPDWLRERAAQILTGDRG